MNEQLRGISKEIEDRLEYYTGMVELSMPKRTSTSAPDRDGFPLQMFVDLTGTAREVYPEYVVGPDDFTPGQLGSNEARHRRSIALSSLFSVAHVVIHLGRPIKNMSGLMEQLGRAPTEEDVIGFVYRGGLWFRQTFFVHTQESPDGTISCKPMCSLTTECTVTVEEKRNGQHRQAV